MPQDFETMIKDVFGDSFSRLTQFQSDQMKRLTDKLTEIAREAVKEDFTKLQTEITELRSRLTVLESERARNAAESLEQF
jgi:polyhydroxyalkanoate synthesis regulator phasin